MGHPPAPAPGGSNRMRYQRKIIFLGYKVGVTNFSYPLHLAIDNFFPGRCSMRCRHLDVPPKKHSPVLWGSSVKSKGEFILQPSHYDDSFLLLLPSAVGATPLCN
jgi:hypothetical protein